MSIHPENIDEVVEVVENNNIVFIKWGATWCPPCKAIQPHFEQLAKKYDGKATFITIDIDVNDFESLASLYSISSVPAFHLFKGSKFVRGFVGANKKELDKMVGDELVNST